MAGGLGDVPPKTLKGGEQPTLATPPRVGPKPLANPKPTRVGKRGGPGGRSPHGGGHGGCPPRTKIGGELPALATPPRVGPKPLANPKPTGVGKWGVQRGKAPWRGAVGVPSQNKKRGRVAHISNAATSGAQAAGKPKANGGGKTGGPGGASPHGRGFGGCAPKNQKRERVARISNPATSGT
jgi:hypothetical protein